MSPSERKRYSRAWTINYLIGFIGMFGGYFIVKALFDTSKEGLSLNILILLLVLCGTCILKFFHFCIKQIPDLLCSTEYSRSEGITRDLLN